MYIIIKQICTDLQWHLDHLSKQTQQTAHRTFRFAEAQQHFGSQKVTSPEITPGQPGMTKNDQKSRRKPIQKGGHNGAPPSLAEEVEGDRAASRHDLPWRQCNLIVDEIDIIWTKQMLLAPGSGMM